MPAPALSAPMALRDWGLLLTLAGLWGGSFLFNGIAVQALPVLTIVLARVALAALILFIVLRMSGAGLPGGRAVWGAFLGMGLLNNAVPFTLIVAGQVHLASGVASILNATTPLFGVLLAHGLTRHERLTTGRLAGVLAGMAGVAVMVGLPRSVPGPGIDPVAALMCLGAALSYACAGLFGRRFKAMGIAPLQTATGQLTASSLILLPVALVMDRPWALALPGTGPLAAVIALATVSTALAYVIYFRLLASAGATNLSLVTLLIPVMAVLLGVGVLDEVLLPRHLAGMALIGIGLLAIDGRVWGWWAARG